MFTEKLYFCIMLLCISIVLSSLEQRCSPEYCNFAGECYIVNNKPNCSCYEETFQGKYCELVKNLCQTDKNRCDIKQRCIPYVGQTVCPGRIEPTKPMCSYNVRAIYGIKEYIVLSFEDLGSIALQITLSTPTYMIAHLPRSDLQRSVTAARHTTNLTTTLKSLGIRRHIRLPYDNAHYYVFQAKHFTLGANQLSVTIESFNTKDQLKPQLQTLSLVVHVVERNLLGCVTRAVFQQCMDPHKPLQVDVEHFTNIQAIVKQPCSPSVPEFQTHWVIFSVDERDVYYTSPSGDQLLFKMPPHKMWYDHRSDISPHLLLMLRLGLREGKGPWLHVRCYLNVTARNVVSEIAGGNYRKVNAPKWLLLDGSTSFDPARSKYANQGLTYTWMLSNFDGSDMVYISYEDVRSKITIPVWKIRPHAVKLITLRVADKLVSSRNHTFKQLVHLITDRQPLKIEIKCVKNCGFYIYAPGKVLHLRVSCYKCAQPRSYEWQMNGVYMNQNKERLVIKLKADMSGELVIDVGVMAGSASGSTMLILNNSEPPTGGNCVIEPEAGLECVTLFHIECKGFVTLVQHPLSYTFKLGSMYEEINNSGEAFLYLNGKDVLTVSICGFHSSCATVELSFTVKPTKLPSSDDLKKMLILGERQKVFCILHKLTDNTTNLDVALQYFKSIKKIHTYSLREMLNTMEIAYKTTTALAPLDSYKSYIISQILERVAFTFEIIRNDTELLDLKEEICLELGVRLTNIVAHCMDKQVEHLHKELILKIFDDPFSEKYVDWTPFGSTVALSISHFIYNSELIFQIFRQIGDEAARFIKPDQPFDYVSAGVNYQMTMHDKNEPINYISNGSACTLNVPVELLAEMRDCGSNNLLVYAWCFETNIFWWAPEPWSPTTAVLAISILNGDHNADLQLQRNWTHDYSFTLRHDKTVIREAYDQTDEVHNSMVIYKIRIPGQVNLLVNFVNTTASLRVLITMNKEPTLSNLHEKSCFVPKGSQNKTIILKNRCSDDGIAYVAVYKANSFDTSHGQFTILLSAQECGVWGKRGNDPYWIKKGCYSQNLKQFPLYAECSSNHLSLFSAKQYPIKPFPIQKRRRYLHNFPINLGCVVFNCLLVLGAVALLILSSLRLRQGRNNLIRVIKLDRDETPPSSENVIVHLRTGGMLLAKTTANVKLVFKSDLGRYKVVIYQDPTNPQLTLNTSCMLRLSDERVQLPCRLTISHDESGRFPSWFCHTIQIDDLKRDLSYTFPIHAWLRRGKKIHVSCYPHEKSSLIRSQLHNVPEPTDCWEKFKIRFRYYSKFYYINWFMMQPIFGPFRFSDESCNIYERTCVWICKTVLTITLVFCYYRKTTYINYYDIEQSDSLMGHAEFLALAIGCYLVTMLFDMFLVRLTRS